MSRDIVLATEVFADALKIGDTFTTDIPPRKSGRLLRKERHPTVDGMYILHMEPEVEDFKIGDLVILKSGGPVMTVVDPSTNPYGRVKCEWFPEGPTRPEAADFPAAALTNNHTPNLTPSYGMAKEDPFVDPYRSHSKESKDAS